MEDLFTCVIFKIRASKTCGIQRMSEPQQHVHKDQKIFQMAKDRRKSSTKLCVGACVPWKPNPLLSPFSPKRPAPLAPAPILPTGEEVHCSLVCEASRSWRLTTSPSSTTVVSPVSCLCLPVTCLKCTLNRCMLTDRRHGGTHGEIAGHPYMFVFHPLPLSDTDKKEKAGKDQHQQCRFCLFCTRNT